MISVENASKRYGKIQAISEVYFTIEPGTITGFVGDNGSGKSTTLKSIVGLVKLDSGNVSIDNALIDKTKIGYLPEERGLLTKESVRSQVEFLASLKGLEGELFEHNFNKYLELLKLHGHENTIVSKLSNGNKQRVQWLITLIHEPKVLILDEPFVGLDVGMILTISEILRDLSKNEVTILFSSHQLSNIEDLCTKVIFIKRGKILFNDFIAKIPGNLKDQYERLNHE